jgi:peptidyl-prolyl cis-trans isomerase C
MRRLSLLAALALGTALTTPPALADSPAGAPRDPVIASVNTIKIHLSDVQAAAQNIPQQMQEMPPDQLFPILVNQQIDRSALLIAAKKQGLEHQADVAQAMERAADIQLENAYVQQHIQPALSDAAVQAEYNKDYANKPGPEQVEARHILVKTQAEAQAIIDQLNKGANFATLAQQDSLDPGAKNGGELGWFTQDQMVKPFADAAFALQPGQYTKTPVQTQFGWHVILCEGKKASPPQALADVQGQIRQQLADAAIKATLADARSHVTIKVYNPDGTPGSQTPPPGQ